MFLRLRYVINHKALLPDKSHLCMQRYVSCQHLLPESHRILLPRYPKYRAVCPDIRLWSQDHGLPHIRWNRRSERCRPLWQSCGSFHHNRLCTCITSVQWQLYNRTDHRPHQQNPLGYEDLTVPYNTDKSPHNNWYNGLGLRIIPLPTSYPSQIQLPLLPEFLHQAVYQKVQSVLRQVLWSHGTLSYSHCRHGRSLHRDISHRHQCFFSSGKTWSYLRRALPPDSCISASHPVALRHSRYASCSHSVSVPSVQTVCHPLIHASDHVPSHCFLSLRQGKDSCPRK